MHKHQPYDFGCVLVSFCAIFNFLYFFTVKIILKTCSSNLVVLVIFENLPVARSDPYFRVLFTYMESYWIPIGFLLDSYWIPIGFLLDS